MLSKLESLTNSIKNIVLYILGPLLAIFAYEKWKGSSKLTADDQAAEAKVDQKLAEEIKTAQDAQKEAQDAEQNYNTIRDQYLANEPKSSSSQSTTLDTSSVTNTESSGESAPKESAST